MTEKIENFRELRVYQAAVELQQEIFQISKAFPNEEMFSLTDQKRRSSRGIGANLAEAWQKRRYQAHFVGKLTDADAEQAETQHWLDTAMNCSYVPPEIYIRLLAKCRDIGRMIGTMINNPMPFCRNFSK